jgi:hypothetical protein
MELHNFKASISLTPKQLEVLNLVIRDNKLNGISFDGSIEYVSGKYVNDEEFWLYWVRADKYWISKDWIRGREIILTINAQPYKKLKKHRLHQGFKRWGLAQRYNCGVFRYAYCSECQRGYLVKIPCKKECCPECGQQNSLYHKQQKMRMYPYVLEMFSECGSVGYFVITTPMWLRERLKDKKERYKFRRYIERLLKREGFKKGVSRWHFAGDSSTKWYPHLNVLIPASYIDDKRLERIKKLLKRRYGIEDIFYEYIKDLPRLNFVIEYVSRPTFNLQNEVEYECIRGTRKFNLWGDFKVSKLKNESKEEFVAYIRELMLNGYFESKNDVMVYALLSGRCANCYEKLSWTTKFYISHYEKVLKLGWGCWVVMDGGVRLPGYDPPGISDNWEEEVWRELL